MQELNCNQVLALLTFFIDNKLSPKLMQSIEYHLNVCADCREKYLNLQKILNNYSEIQKKICEDNEFSDGSYKAKQYKIFKENLSAYVDNELGDEENLRIRKIAIANADARQDLENILYFRELLKESFQKTKNCFKSDFSETIVGSLFKNTKSSDKCLTRFYVQMLFSVVLCMIFFILVHFLL